MNARRKLNLLAVPLMLLLAAAVIDATVARLRTPDNAFGALAGDEFPVSGKLEGPVLGGQTASGPTDTALDPGTLLQASGDLQGLQLRFEEVVGTLWRGRVRVAPDALPGRRVFWVHERLVPPGSDAQPTILTVYEDAAAYRAGFHSVFRRLLGLRPWWVAAGLLPLCLGLLACSYVISGREEAELRRRGIGPLYKLARRGGQWEVVFGIGTAQGVARGDRLALLDDRLDHVTFVVALEVREDYAATLVDGALPIRHDFHIARLPDAARRGPDARDDVADGDDITPPPPPAGGSDR